MEKYNVLCRCSKSGLNQGMKCLSVDMDKTGKAFST